MDYSFFTAAPQPYHFLGLPPTPAHSHTPQPEEYHNAPSTASVLHCSLLNVEPTNTWKQNSYDHAAFQAFEPPFRFDPNALIQPSQPPATPLHNSIPVPNPIGDGGTPPLDLDNDPNVRDSSEEKDNLTPAQSRRKAQNRAAQRAFRERKERHVKDLEQKLTSLEHTSTTLASDNERLKRELEKIATENEILRATTSTNSTTSSSNPHPSRNSHALHPPTINGPTTFSPTQFYTTMLSAHPSTATEISHKITVSRTTGERLLGAGATWDLIQAHPSFKRGLVDIGDVSERLRKAFQCDGQGPVFAEGDIRRAIEESVAAGSDELI